MLLLRHPMLLSPLLLIMFRLKRWQRKPRKRKIKQKAQTPKPQFLHLPFCTNLQKVKDSSPLEITKKWFSHVATYVIHRLLGIGHLRINNTTLSMVRMNRLVLLGGVHIRLNSNGVLTTLQRTATMQVILPIGESILLATMFPIHGEH